MAEGRDGIGSGAASFTSVDFEGNGHAGGSYGADVWYQVDTGSVDVPNSLMFNGCGFVRGGYDNGYLSNCIILALGGSKAKHSLNLNGSVFRGLGSYTPSVSRKYVYLTNPALIEVNKNGAIFEASLEA
jgi:hypothetical protein